MCVTSRTITLVRLLILFLIHAEKCFVDFNIVILKMLLLPSKLVVNMKQQRTAKQQITAKDTVKSMFFYFQFIFYKANDAFSEDIVEIVLLRMKSFVGLLKSL